jgi:hypothetical protein
VSYVNLANTHAARLYDLVKDYWNSDAAPPVRLVEAVGIAVRNVEGSLREVMRFDLAILEALRISGISRPDQQAAHEVQLSHGRLLSPGDTES